VRKYGRFSLSGPFDFRDFLAAERPMQTVLINGLVTAGLRSVSMCTETLTR
jgi:hypothetical protein